MYKIAVLTSHPIQYQAPFFKKLANRPEIDLMVYFCWDFGVKESTYDSGFGRKIKWDIPLLDGYRFKFLKNFSSNPGSGKWYGEINPGIISEVWRGEYDAILIHGWNCLTKWLAFLVSFLSKTPVFLRGDNPSNQESLKSSFKIKIKKLILGNLFKNISIFLYVGEENKKFFKYYGVSENKLIFCPHAIDNERFLKEAEKIKPNKNEFKKEIGLNKDQTVILFTGKLIEKKHPFDLLKAYQRAANNSSKVALVFVGDGALRPELEKYAKEHNLKNVHFVGFKNQTELPKYYTLADIFILPSGLGETWGLVVNEAMCFGLPIIVSDLVGCGPDLVKYGENGYIFPVRDIKKLTEYLLDLIQNPQKRKKFGKKSFEIIQNYSYEKGIEGILKAFSLLR